MRNELEQKIFDLECRVNDLSVTRRNASRKMTKTLELIGSLYVQTTEYDPTTDRFTSHEHGDFDELLRTYRLALSTNANARTEIEEIAEVLKQLRKERSK